MNQSAFSIILSLSVFSGLVLAYAIYLKIKEIKKQDFEKASKTLMNSFISISYVNLPTNTFKEIYAVDFVRAAIGTKGDAQVAINTAIHNGFVSQTYIPRMEEFADLSTLQKRLEGNPIISEEYVGATHGWIRACFIPVEYDLDGTLKSVLYTIQRIEGQVQSLRDKLNIEETLLECVRTLSKNTDADKSINQLLANVGSFHNADRTYIFEFDKFDKTTSNTYEWCKQGITPQIDNLQNLNIKEIQMFVNLCKMRVLKLVNTNYFSENSVEYKLLSEQNITSLMVVPLMQGEKMIGFIGVDNPQLNREINTVLNSVSSFVVTELEKKQFINDLFALSYKDKMTGAYNRHAYMRDTDELLKSAPANIGIVYGDINGLKAANDNHGHESGDKLISDGIYALRKYFGNDNDEIYRIGGDEFVVISNDVSEALHMKNYENLLIELGKDPILSLGQPWAATCEDINELVKVAEQRMYEAKRKYYETHDRRSR